MVSDLAPGWILIHLDQLLEERQMTATELADRIGMTQANVSILRTGKAKAIRFTTLVAICDALKCQPGDLLSFEQDDAASNALGVARAGRAGVRMLDAGKRPIAVIKAMRELQKLGLREAKELVESVPAVVITGLGREEASVALAKLRKAGATVELT